MKELEKLAKLIKQRNAVEKEITSIIGRPASIGHLGEYIASRIFNIKLSESASQKGIDGHFIEEPLAGRTVNIKWYAKREGLLDITPDSLPDFYLVLAGPKPEAMTSRGRTRPWFIESVYLFEAQTLVQQLQARGIKIGIATSVRQEFWNEAEVFPNQNNSKLTLSAEQCEAIAQFES